MIDKPKSILDGTFRIDAEIIIEEINSLLIHEHTTRDRLYKSIRTNKGHTKESCQIGEELISIVDLEKELIKKLMSLKIETPSP